MLRAINARLEVLLDRDHLIGHAYFMGLRAEPTIDKLKETFAMNILPLLSEYFYADLGRVGLVLGEPFVHRLGSSAALARFGHEAADQLGDRATYRLTPADNLSTADFRSIYGDTGV
jgi:5-methylcytosine-specific restriction protein B